NGRPVAAVEGSTRYILGRDVYFACGLRDEIGLYHPAGIRIFKSDRRGKWAAGIYQAHLLDVLVRRSTGRAEREVPVDTRLNGGRRIPVTSDQLPVGRELPPAIGLVHHGAVALVEELAAL